MTVEVLWMRGSAMTGSAHNNPKTVTWDPVSQTGTSLIGRMLWVPANEIHANFLTCYIRFLPVILFYSFSVLHHAVQVSSGEMWCVCPEEGGEREMEEEIVWGRNRLIWRPVMGVPAHPPTFGTPDPGDRWDWIETNNLALERNLNNKIENRIK